MGGVCLTAIYAENLSFYYGDEPVFTDVGFSLRTGDFAALVGTNGSGKSTLLHLLIREITPATGVIRLYDQDIRQFKSWHRFGYLPQKAIQNAAGFPATATEIVTAGLYHSLGLTRPVKETERKKVRQALATVGMEAGARELFAQLSGGQQQRVLLARVLVSEPEVMLLDEPTTGVDSGTVQTLYSLLAELNTSRKLTVLMVTHDAARAAAFASRILCLEEGSLVELDKESFCQELAHKHKHPLKLEEPGGDQA
jgi:zinc transport system ATP-binding protein